MKQGIESSRIKQLSLTIFVYLSVYIDLDNYLLTGIVDEQPVAHCNNKGVDGGTGVQHPVEVVQAALLRLAHNLEILALDHHALGDYPGGQPCLDSAK